MKNHSREKQAELDAIKHSRPRTSIPCGHVFNDGDRRQKEKNETRKLINSNDD